MQPSPSAPDHGHQHADRQPEALVGRVQLRGPRVRRGLAAWARLPLSAAIHLNVLNNSHDRMYL